EAATPGPWMWVGPDLESRDGGAVIALSVECTRYCHGGIPRVEMDDADSEFLEHARADVPALVAEVRRLRAVLAAIRDWHGRHGERDWCDACWPGTTYPCWTRTTAERGLGIEEEDDRT